MHHIKKLRFNANIETAKEAADKLKIKPNTLTMIENGHRKPSVWLAYRMAKLYGCTLDDIFLPYIRTNGEKNKK